MFEEIIKNQINGYYNDVIRILKFKGDLFVPLRGLYNFPHALDQISKCVIVYTMMIKSIGLFVSFLFCFSLSSFAVDNYDYLFLKSMLSPHSFLSVRQAVQSAYQEAMTEHLLSVKNSFVQYEMFYNLRNGLYNESDLLNDEVIAAFKRQVQSRAVLKNIPFEISYNSRKSELIFSHDLSFKVRDLMKILSRKNYIKMPDGYKRTALPPVTLSGSGISGIRTCMSQTGFNNQTMSFEEFSILEHVFSDFLMQSIMMPEMDNISFNIGLKFFPAEELEKHRRSRTICIQEYKSKDFKTKHYAVYAEAYMPLRARRDAAISKEYAPREMLHLCESIRDAIIDQKSRYFSENTDQNNPVIFSELPFATQEQYWKKFEKTYSVLSDSFEKVKLFYPEEHQAQSKLQWIKGIYPVSPVFLSQTRENLISSVSFPEKDNSSPLTENQFIWLYKQFEKNAMYDIMASFAGHENLAGMGFGLYKGLVKTKRGSQESMDYNRAHIEKFNALIKLSQRIDEFIASNSWALKPSKLIKLMTDINPAYTTLLVEDIGHGYGHYLTVFNIAQMIVSGNENSPSLKTILEQMRMEFNKDPQYLEGFDTVSARERFIELLATKTSDQDQWFKKQENQSFFPSDYAPAEISKIDWEAIVLASMFHDISTLHYFKDRKLHHIAGAKNAYQFIEKQKRYFRKMWIKDSDQEFQIHFDALKEKVIFLILHHDGLWGKDKASLLEDIKAYEGYMAFKEKRQMISDESYLLFQKFVGFVTSLVEDEPFSNNAQAKLEAELFYFSDKMDGLNLRDRILSIDTDHRPFFDSKFSLEERIKVYFSQYKFHYHSQVDRLGIGLYGLLSKLNPDYFLKSIGRGYFHAKISVEKQTEEFIEGMRYALNKDRDFVEALKSCYEVVSALIRSNELGSIVEIKYDNNGKPVNKASLDVWHVTAAHLDNLRYAQKRFYWEIMNHAASLEGTLEEPVSEIVYAIEQGRKTGKIQYSQRTDQLALSELEKGIRGLEEKLNLGLNGDPLRSEKDKFRILDAPTFHSLMKNTIMFNTEIPTLIICKTGEEIEKVKEECRKRPQLVHIKTHLFRKGYSVCERIQYLAGSSDISRLQFIVQTEDSSKDFNEQISSELHAETDILKYGFQNLSVDSILKEQKSLKILHRAA